MDNRAGGISSIAGSLFLHRQQNTFRQQLVDAGSSSGSLISPLRTRFTLLQQNTLIRHRLHPPLFGIDALLPTILASSIASFFIISIISFFLFLSRLQLKHFQQLIFDFRSSDSSTVVATATGSFTASSAFLLRLQQVTFLKRRHGRQNFEAPIGAQHLDHLQHPRRSLESMSPFSDLVFVKQIIWLISKILNYGQSVIDWV